MSCIIDKIVIDSDIAILLAEANNFGFLFPEETNIVDMRSFQNNKPMKEYKLQKFILNILDKCKLPHNCSRNLDLNAVIFGRYGLYDTRRYEYTCTKCNARFKF